MNPIINGKAITDILKKSPGMTAREIMSRLGLDGSNVTRVTVRLANMKKDGLLTSKPVAGTRYHVYSVAETKLPQVTPAPTLGAAALTKTPADSGAAPLDSLVVSIAQAVARQIEAQIEEEVSSRLSAVATALRSRAADVTRQVLKEQVDAAMAELPSHVSAVLQTLAMLRAPAASPAPEVKPAPAPQHTPQPQVGKHDPHPTSAPRTNLLGVTIIGLLPGQEDMIRREFGKELRLSFIGSGEGATSRLRALCAGGAPIIQMTRFGNHSTTDAIKSAGGNLILLSGGMTSLRDKLTELYVEHTKDRQASEVSNAG